MQDSIWPCGWLEGFARGRPTHCSKRRAGIRTRYLKMALDHAEGIFDAEVLKGTFRGSILSQLTLAELRILQAEVSSDPDSVSVLNAYMDRASAGGRHNRTGNSQDTGHSGSGDRQRRQPGGAMCEEEARNLLGLAQGASPQEIKSAHRRLIKQVHPDHGGTDYLAHKINLARELLLGKTAETADSG